MQSLMPMMMAALLLVPTLWGIAHASEDDRQEALFSRFLEGYQRQDSLQVLDEIEAVLALEDPPQSVFLPSATIKPLAKAILALEAVEGERDRVRYRISYGIERIPHSAKPSLIPFSFIQIDRFSLGAAIRQEVIDAYGGEHVGPPAAFDVGPHVSWRLITRPVQGTWADIQAVGRIDLSEDRAQEMQCLNRLCLSTDISLADDIPHSEMQETALNLDVPYPVVRAGLLTPAAVIAQLTKDVSFSEAGRQREVPDLPEPFLEAVIEINLAQDSALSSAMRWGGLMDDSVAAIWQLLNVIPMGEHAQTPMAYHAQAYECRRGAMFPENGEVCP